MDKKSIVIVCLLVALAIVSYIAFKPAPIIDNTAIELRLKTLERENDSIARLIADERIKQNEYRAKIDSLQTLKQKIKYVYIKKDKEIDSASVGTVLNDFKNVFANSGIK